MPPKKDRCGDQQENSTAIPSPSYTCPDCESSDPQRLAAHQLLLARQGLESARKHLQQYFAQHVEADRRKEDVNAVCSWLSQQIKAYHGYVHPHTGVTLPWWEARDLAHDSTKRHSHSSPHPHDPLNAMSQDIPQIIERLLTGVATDPWAQGHIILMETGLGHAHNVQETVHACQQFARRWPQDSDAWEREAAWWGSHGTGATLPDRQAGEDGEARGYGIPIDASHD